MMRTMGWTLAVLVLLAPAAAARADADGVAEAYDADGVRLNQDGTVQVRLVDDLASETGIGGRYVTIWKWQADGGWKVRSDVGAPGA